LPFVDNVKKFVEVRLETSKEDNGKSMPLQASTNPYCSRKLKLLNFVDSWHMRVVGLIAICTGHLYFPGDTPSTHFS
jgi:hypothetical protein